METWLIVAVIAVVSLIVAVIALFYWLRKSRRRPCNDVSDSDEECDEDVQRALCSSCREPLEHVAEVPRWRAALLCACPGRCDRCKGDILPGELHFACPNCVEVKVCKECGPGSCIERVYDYIDRKTGESHVVEMPKAVIHSRKKKGVKRGLVMQSPAATLALEVVQRARSLASSVSRSDEECFDADWMPQGAMEQLLGPKDSSSLARDVTALCVAAQGHLAGRSTLTEAAVPCKVFGDLHGQLRDLLLLLELYGWPSDEGPTYVFNGDFVDRGHHQLETVCLLFALLVAYPTKIFLNRGNHEDPSMNQKYGFTKACDEVCGTAAGASVFQAFTAAFNVLPLACLVGGRVLTLHGGIGNGKWSLDELRAVRRPLEHKDIVAPGNEWIWNIMWSDPIEEDADSARKTFGMHQSPRGKSSLRFGWNITEAFCAKENLDLVVRSHQAKKGGYGFDIMHDDSLIRVFSARDYENNANDGAVLSITLMDGEEPGGLLGVRPQVLRSLVKHE